MQGVQFHIVKAFCAISMVQWPGGRHFDTEGIPMLICCYMFELGLKVSNSNLFR